MKKSSYLKRQVLLQLPPSSARSWVFRETALAGVFGATTATDAYLVATIIPWMLFSVISTALSTTLIPVYTMRVHEAGDEAGLRFINTLVNFILVICLIMIIAGPLLLPDRQNCRPGISW